MYELSIGTKTSDLEQRNGSYFALFHRIWYTCVAFQHITASARIELIDQKSERYLLLI